MAELLQMFYDPAAVFQKVREKKIWLAPFIAIMLLAAIVSGLIINIIGMENLTRKQLESNPRMVERMGGEAKVEEAAQKSNTPVRKALGYCIAIVGAAIVMLVIGAVMLAVMNMMGAGINFAQSIGATSYAFFPFSVVTSLMSALILVLARDPAELDVNNLIHLNVGAFIDSASKPLQSLAKSIDLITFCQIAMLSYGLSIVGRVSFGKVLVAVVALWVVYVLIKMGGSLLF